MEARKPLLNAAVEPSEIVELQAHIVAKPAAGFVSGARFAHVPVRAVSSLPRRFFAVFCTFLYVIVVLIGVLKGQKLVAKGELSISILTFESEN